MSQPDTIDIDAMLDRAINAGQRSRLDAYPEPLRRRLYDRIRDSLLASVRMQVECCSTGIHPVALERLIQAESEQWGQEQQCQERLREWVRAGAPFVMLNALQGVSRREFDVVRKGLGLSGATSRKSVGDDESARIYRQWESLGKPQGMDGLMELHVMSQQPLYILWGLVRDWGHVQARLGRLRQGRGW